MHYIVYCQDHSGFEGIESYSSREEAEKMAKQLFNEGDGGYAVVSAHSINDADISKELSEENALVIYKN